MGSRIVEIAFGMFFISLSAVIFSTPTTACLSGGASVGGLGAEVIYSAIRGRRSLLSRIGPLP